MSTCLTTTLVDCLHLTVYLPRCLGAGGQSTCALSVSPAAKGLFLRSIIESGACTGQAEVSSVAKQLKPQTRNSTGIKAVGTTDESGTDERTPPPPVPDMAAFTATMERSLEKMVNAAMARTGRTPTRTPPGSRSGSNGSQRAGAGFRAHLSRDAGAAAERATRERIAQSSKF